MEAPGKHKLESNNSSNHDRINTKNSNKHPPSQNPTSTHLPIPPQIQPPTTKKLTRDLCQPHKPHTQKSKASTPQNPKPLRPHPHPPKYDSKLKHIHDSTASEEPRLNTKTKRHIPRLQNYLYNTMPEHLINSQRHDTTPTTQRWIDC